MKRVFLTVLAFGLTCKLGAAGDQIALESKDEKIN